MWSDCPGTEKPADIGSRGEFATSLPLKSVSWSRRKEQLREIISETVLLTACKPDLESCIPITNFSCCDKLFRLTALVQRFVRNLKIKAKLLKEGTVCHGEVSEKEIAHAELQWLRGVQKNLKAQANYGHLEHKFGLYENENEIVRC